MASPTSPPSIEAKGRPSPLYHGGHGCLAQWQTQGLSLAAGVRGGAPREGLGVGVICTCLCMDVVLTTAVSVL
jgi:hypothetical protein